MVEHRRPHATDSYGGADDTGDHLAINPAAGPLAAYNILDDLGLEASRVQSARDPAG